MFKLESYITPILLSYFDKYIKNFKLENSQVSLWGGDAAFHNLDLRLEVLEQELQSPFSFISGHIRELLIHVPWTKLTSEPIVVTINTIECVLKLRDAGSSPENHAAPQKSKTRSVRNKVSHKHQEVEAPPNYVQLLITKIVNNIRIFCNNVILKYVEEDIVLSMNIKHLKLEACNENWETAYVDVSPTQVIQRKVVGISDLTICLDKRNASGKIDVYQEPMLYRCSMKIHVLRVYHSASANKTSLTRIDVYCNNMEFSMTEQQVPMFARLLLLLYSLQQKHLKNRTESQDNLGGPVETKDTTESSESWTGWAWSYFSAVLPTLDESWDNKEQSFLDQTGHIVHVGAYVDQASLTFKLSESTGDKGYYSQKKIRYAPLLSLQLQGIYSEFYMVGAKWLNSCFGISEVLLLPVGFCSCAHNELEDSQFQPYLRIGSKALTHKVDSLFYLETAENKGVYRHYITNWDFHVLSKPEPVLLERTPAFVCDYIYQMELPDDVSSEILSDLASNLEFSNLAERSLLRICFSPIRFRICSGLFHRMNTLQVAASSYDYSPYYVPKTELSFHELLPPSSEDFDALNEFIPNKSIKITVYDPLVEVQCMDHPFFIPVKGNLFRKPKKHSNSIAQSLRFEKIPKLTIECKAIEASFSFPMYVNRLVHTTCQLPEPPKQMFDACFSKQDISVVGLCCRLVLKSNNITTIIVPFNLSYLSKSILKPHCWTHPDTLHTEIRFESDNLTFNGTKAKLMVMSELIDKVVRRDTEDLSILINTSLLFDAAKDQGMPYLEFYMEGVKFKKITTNSTVSFDVLLGSIKAFIFESLDSSKTNIQQVLFLSGPEPKDSKPRSGKSALEELPLFTVTMQYPTKPELQAHPPLLIFNLQEIKICIDPLLCKWFLYQPINIMFPKQHDGSDHAYFPSRNFSETFGSTSETPRRTHIESVHSSSDREFLSKSLHKLPRISEEESVDLQENINIFLKTWSVVWKGMIFNGYIHQGTIYFPMTSISAIGSQGIEEAVRESANKGSNVLVITLPFAKIQSAQKQNVLQYLKTLPVKLPDNVWSLDKPSFPWTMSIADLQCYTVQSGKKSSFLKPASLNATVGLSTKSALSEASSADKAPPDASGNKTIGQLGVYIHIDMTPIVISTSESQICLLASILYGLAEVGNNLFPNKKLTEINPTAETLPPIVVGASTSLSPTALDDTSENTMPTEDLEAEKETNENVKFTAWIQWTITRFSFELLTNDSVVKKETEKAQLKLFIDVEDIVTSLDYQSVYLKLKCKVGSVGIQHFKRKSEKNKWQPGPFSGVIMRLREDVRVEKYEENGFISVTITRASCQHTHNLWGTVQKTKQENKHKSSMVPSTSRYITEIVVNVQPIDFVIPLKTLMNFYFIMTPLLDVSTVEDQQQQQQHHETEPKPPAKESSWFNNQSLPLAYLECKDIRIIIPSAELAGTGCGHDVFVLQLSKINLSPSVANPICRAPVRPDIYKQAVQSRILNIPGSDLEDRQYQLDIIGTSISTAAWDDLDHVLNIGGTSQSARGVSENPALEWNNLEQGQLSIVPILNLKQVSERFDICIVAAPTMLYKSDILICGNSFEINIVTDIDVHISMSQLKLASALINEFLCPSELGNCDDYETRRPKVTFPYSRFEKYAYLNDTVENEITEFYKDSGIDTSEIISVLSSKSHAQKNAPFPNLRKVSKSATPQVSQQVTSEVLLTAGKISCSFYDTLLNQTFQGKKGKKGRRKKPVKDEDLNYEASEEESVDETNKNHQNYIPLIFFCVSQPNIYASNMSLVSRSQISCFDISVKMNCAESAPIATVPTVKDYPVDLIETRSGNPDPGTGIPPAFLTLKYAKEKNNPLNLSVDVSRPTKLAVSASKLSCLITLANKIAGNFAVRTVPVRAEKIEDESVTEFRRMKDKLKGIDTLRFQTDQIVLLLESEKGTEMNFTVGRLKNRLVLSERPEKIHNITKIDCATFSVRNETLERLLMHPWSVSVEFNAFLEPWQNANSDPQMHVAIESDCIMLHVSPEQVRLVENVTKEICEFVSSLPFGNETSEDDSSDLVKIPQLLQDRDQHYKDDLRAGAFQFIDANTSNIEELPLPYQVMFWNTDSFSAMAWRYPQPRALTKVRVFPVPFDIQSDFPGNLEISCNLQYWSEYHGCYLSYAQFSLSESEVCYLDLPKYEPQRAVACIWRVILSSSNEDGGVSVSSRALVACMRIDSYFNKALVPNLTCAVYVSKFELALHSNFNNFTGAVLPENLKHYASDFAFPETNCFMKVILENFRVHVASWDFEMLLIDVNCVMRCTVLDYMFLAERILCEQFTAKAEIHMAKELTASLITNEIQMLFGPSIAHTLAVNAQIWNQSQQIEPDFIILTRYVICNDTNINVRFGQTATDEDILLPSRCFHLYCWRSQRHKRKLRIALEEESWIWSKPFRIDADTTQTVQITTEHNMSIIIIVKSLSTTQKQITIAGQFLIANMLSEQFEFRIVHSERDEAKKLPVHMLGGKSVTPSMLLNSKADYFLCLRFFGLESAWTGCIPLKEHTKGAQPWLVKVALQEKGQFLSIWCRIVVQDLQKGNKRILAMLWPLFTVKSNLPLTSNIHIETPSLNIHLDSVVSGKGEIQQLYCPGTTDHSHQLTFKLEDGTSISSYIPLNYSLVNQQEFFKKNGKENIETILSSLKEYETSKWPYLPDDLENINWIVDDQPQTAVQVRYRNACQYSSALMVELLPWCLMVNTFGCPLSLMTNNTELCRIPQNGIVTPPKLDEIFHLGIDAGMGWCYSGALQLAKSDWSQTFYMPKISGTLPLEGNIHVAIRCGFHMCMVSLSSMVHDEIRLLKLSSTHVFSNHLKTQIQVICFAVPEGEQTFDIPTNMGQYAFTVAPHSKINDSGVSIIQWYLIDQNFDPNNEIALYVSFLFDEKSGWSCPINVDRKFKRKSFYVKYGKKSVPLVLTSQEYKGQIYISLYHDDHPQTLIENKSTVGLYCAQSVSEAAVARECRHFKWTSRLDSGSSVYYTMPFVSEKFPELPQTCFSEKIVFAYVTPEELQWSTPVSITSDLEQFVRIPMYGDVKLMIKVTAYATLIMIKPVSQVEINAIDIRGRLSMHELYPSSSIDEKKDISTKDAEKSSLSVFKTPSDVIFYDSVFTPTIPLKNNVTSVHVLAFVKSFSIVFLLDTEYESEEQEVARFTMDYVGADVKQTKYFDLKLIVSDIQFDNLLYSKESYDFPVVLVNQDVKYRRSMNIFNATAKRLLETASSDALVLVDLRMETWQDSVKNILVTGVRDVRVMISPLSCYIEDLYIFRLTEYFNSISPVQLITWPERKIVPMSTTNPIFVKVPDLIVWQSSLVANPLNLRHFVVEPLYILLSVHSSMKMYIALDQSPLQFGRFERRRLLTTPYRLGHAMTMHYLSGAIFGAGWVVSSLELLGSPSGLARAMSTGLRDFVSLPYRGLVQGPWAFLIGVTHGSASLMRHLTAGTLQSVTKLASSVARNLDRLTMDEEHLKRTEEQRRRKPQGVTQGFMQGLTGLGISLLGAVGGIAHHPLQSLMAEGASPRSLAAGVGLGLVGVITKPLSGAAELVALTGQGLLQGAGWNPLPQPRICHISSKAHFGVNSALKYQWKLLRAITNKNILFVTDATVLKNSVCNAVALILTSDALMIVDTDEDAMKRIIGLSQIQIMRSEDPTLLVFRIVTPVPLSLPKMEDDGTFEMDPACRARVADYVRSTASLLQLSDDRSSDLGSVPIQVPDLTGESNEQLSFYVNPLIKSYFNCLVSLAKQHYHNNYNFPVI